MPKDDADYLQLSPKGAEGNPRLLSHFDPAQGECLIWLPQRDGEDELS